MRRQDARHNHSPTEIITNYHKNSRQGIPARAFERFWKVFDRIVAGQVLVNSYGGTNIPGNSFAGHRDKYHK